MHADLSPHLHTEECNAIVRQLRQCHQENPWKKFVGSCNELDVALVKCLKKEREQKRKTNYGKSLEMKEKIAQGVKKSSL